MTEHTATPWHAVDDYHPTRACLEIQDGDGRSIATIYNGPGDDDIKDADGITRNDLARVANAAFIVTACNAHTQLVTLLKMARPLVLSSPDPIGDIVIAMDALITDIEAGL